MNKIETIRQACIKANPSIKDLVFGCEVKDAYGQKHIVILKNEKGFTLQNIGGIGGEIIEHPYPGIDPNDIIGRPIRLADVLLALGRLEIANKVGIDATGKMTRVPLYDDRRHIEVYWNLLKDDLTQQSDETIDFLYELLK